jgi:chorismate dehydratase
MTASSSRIDLDRSLRVGKVNFINTLPIFSPLESGAVRHDFEIIEGTPTELNGLLAGDELDLGLVSSIEYGRRFEEYLLLPHLSISCTRRVCSVLLLSRVGLQELAGEEIVLTPKSHTSIALLKLLLSRHLTREPYYRIADHDFSGLHWPDEAAAILAIGDDALRLQKDSKVKLVLDLGAAWYEWTGRPGVFAVWALRRDRLAQKDGLFHRAHAILLEARDYGLSHLDQVAATVEQCSWFSPGECKQYLQTIEYDLDDDKQDGLRLFFDMLHQAGALERRVELNFLTRWSGAGPKP